MKNFFKLLPLIAIALFLFSGCVAISPVIQSSASGDIKNLDIAIRNGGNVNEKDQFNLTPLIWATRNGRLETVKYLIEKGADVDLKTGHNETALHWAAAFGHIDIAKFLIEKGADTEVRNYQNKTPIDIAAVSIKQNLQNFVAERKKEKIEAQAVLVKKEAQETKAKQEQEIATKINDLIIQKDFEGLKQLTEKDPNLVNYIQDEELRLMLTGPKGMKVGDIRKLLKNGKSEIIVVSLIKRVQVPYKEFTLEEIETLTKMELTDKTISAMIDVTTELLKDERRRKEQEFYQAENKKLMDQKAQPQTIIREVQTNNQNNNSQLQDKATEILLQEGSKMLLKSLFR
ncbi:ankyrin repeat domain-containing protein [Sulfurimonas sp.]|uniref:ankyrin repeat domain-containing protein n=1 Tax=Sulfurimonas sp. TaxID=2022749 RepID=UPI0025FCE3FB|nr:ankyrin repeat domain-containing protein [Sulfurimonas sp.]MDD5157760.1 ankyrin repeat domain-containing protein [Sulfurimonas sp.]